MVPGMEEKQRGKGHSLMICLFGWYPGASGGPEYWTMELQPHLAHCSFSLPSCLYFTFSAMVGLLTTDAPCLSALKGENPSFHRGLAGLVCNLKRMLRWTGTIISHLICITANSRPPKLSSIPELL